MKELITDFLQSSHTDPVYFITLVIDIAAYFLGRKLKQGLSSTQRALYQSVIIVGVVLTSACLSKFFGLFQDWKELGMILKSWLAALPSF